MNIIDKIFLLEETRELTIKEGGLTKWFKEKWVDISRKNKKGGHPPCGASAGKKQRKGGKAAYPKCVPAAKAARMSSKQKKSAVIRKRKYGSTKKGRAKNVSTFSK
jgi:hypothetical protein